jgi:hypothetical protein
MLDSFRPYYFLDSGLVKAGVPQGQMLHPDVFDYQQAELIHH